MYPMKNLSERKDMLFFSVTKINSTNRTFLSTETRKNIKNPILIVLWWILMVFEGVDKVGFLYENIYLCI